MITASLVLYKTSMTEIDTVVNCVINSKCVSILYVIDNFQTEENKNYFSRYDFIEYIPHENTGYGSSHNIALDLAIKNNSDYHLILNPDIEFNSNVLNELKKYMDNHGDVVYILPKVIYPNGEIQFLCKLLPKPSDLFRRRFLSKTFKNSKKNDLYELKKFGYDKIINPPCLSGCFMFLRVSTISKYNVFFDERYFMYFEDFDLMRRLHKVGKTIFYPYVYIVHNHKQESYKSKKMLFVHISSALHYFNKWGWFFDKERRKMNKQIIKEIENL